MGKIGFYNQIETDIKSAADAMGDAMVENLSFLDTQNGIKSFLKKEKPVWTHTNAKDEWIHVPSYFMFWKWCFLTEKFVDYRLCLIELVQEMN